MPDIKMPDGVVVRFPDTMSQEEIKGLIASKFPDLAKPVTPPASAGQPFGVTTGLPAMIEHGASLGLADEVAGAGRATGRFLRNAFTGQPLTEGVSDAFNAGIDETRAGVDQARDRSPILGTAAEIGGALVTGPGRMATSAGQTLLQRMMAAATEAGIYGGVYGGATAEGGAVERAEGAVKGAAQGAAIGGALPVVVKAGEIATRPIRTVSNMFRPAANAEGRVVEALSRDHTTPERVASSLRRAQESGVPNTIADVAGRNTQRTLRQARTIPGAGSEKIDRFLHERQLAQPDRVMGAVQRALGGDDVFRVADDVAKTRSSLADKMYAKAYENAKPVNTIPVIAKIDDGLKVAAGKIEGALKKVRKSLVGKVDLEALHNVKMELDDAIGAAKRAGKNNQARVLMGVKQRLVRSMDRASPDYKSARNTFSSLSDLTDALTEGQKFLNRDARLTTLELSKMTAGEKEMFRLGASEALANKINSAPDGASIARRIFGSPSTRGKLEAVFPDKRSFREFQAIMLREGKTTATNQFVRGNSQTVDKMAEQLDALGTDTIGDLVRLDFSGAARRAGGAALNVAQGITPKTAEKIADILTSTDPATIEAIMQALSRRSAASQVTGRAMNAGIEVGARGGAIGIGGN